MNEARLPFKRPLGIQLATGVSGPSIFKPSKHSRHYDFNENWLTSTDNSIPDSFMNLRISGSDKFYVDDQSTHFDPSNEITTTIHSPIPTRRTLDYNDITTTDNYSENSILDSDILDDDDTQFDEHIRDSLLMKLPWGRLTPSFPQNGSFQIYNDIKDITNNRMYLSPVNSVGSFHHDYLPRDVVNNLSKSDSSISLPTKYDRNYNNDNDTHYKLIDPTVRDTFIIGKIQTSFDIRNYIDYHEIFAYSHGRTQSILRLSLMKQEETGKNTINETNITDIDLKNTIKTIKIPILSKAYARYSDIIAVLTTTSLILIKIKSIDSKNNENQLKYNILDPLKFSSLGDYPWSDVTFNPMDPQQFALIDTKGNYVTGKIPTPFRQSCKLSLDKKTTGTIYDPESLSSRKHISWSSKDSHILVMDESKLVEINLVEKWQSEIVQAKSWSRLLDFIQIDEDYKIMLTSMEVIILRTNRDLDQTTRILSWKHNLNDSDMTYRIFCQSIILQGKQVYLNYITSKKHNKVYICGFTIDQSNNLVQLIEGVSIIDMPGLPNKIQSLQFLEESVETMDEQNHVSFNIFAKEIETGSISRFTITNERMSFEPTIINPSPLKDTTELTDIKPEIKCIHETISKSIRKKFKRDKKLESDNNDIEAFEEYGMKLSEALNNYITSDENEAGNDPQLISNLTEPPKVINDIEEFSSFLSQFFEHYKEEHINFTNLPVLFHQILNEKINDFDIFYNKLLQCWSILGKETIYYTKEIVKEIILETVTYSKGNPSKHKCDITYETLSASSKELINEWDNYDPEDEFSETKSTIPFSSQPQFTLSTQSQIPTIRSSQNKVSKKKINRGDLSRRSNRTSNTLENSQRDSILQNTLPSSMAPAFTLMGSSFQSSQLSQVSNIASSQMDGSQRPKKKKKKKMGGFN
ncbi:hypothetical protein C6P45_003751 [Maudiozyma exigua]|uniref:RNA polymerase I-specific transcription initiation factor RRN6 n=1 Tax=Maudiozyma exigua TaxID=34358 RepID=A0A9P6WBG8_MAUEX|nr:hypothetical protein C6P45_003751 [Kazachstania exigua]